MDATDEFLKNRVMNLPESVVAGTHNTEEGTWICDGASLSRAVWDGDTPLLEAPRNETKPKQLRVIFCT